jgi:NTE family protein
MRIPGKQPVLGLALGGGAARGTAHIGVLRVLEAAGIQIDVVAGTSMGAIVGGAYLAHSGVAALEAQVRAVLTSEEFRRNRINFLRETKRQRGGLLFSMANLVRRGIFYGVSTLRPSFLSAEAFAGSLATVIPDVDIESLPRRFGAVALDIETAEEIVLCAGSLRRAAEASSAIPGILPPVRLDGRVLIDGGWVDKVPVLPTFKMGADIVIAVDISVGLEPTRGFARGLDIMVRANAVKDETLTAFQRRLADVVIEPEVGHVHWANFGAFEECIEAGERAAHAALPAIQKLLERERLLSWLRPARGKRAAAPHLGSVLLTETPL